MRLTRRVEQDLAAIVELRGRNHRRLNILDHCPRTPLDSEGHVALEAIRFPLTGLQLCRQLLDFEE